MVKQVAGIQTGCVQCVDIQCGYSGCVYRQWVDVQCVYSLWVYRLWVYSVEPVCGKTDSGYTDRVCNTHPVCIHTVYSVWIYRVVALVGISLIGFTSGLCLIHREDIGIYIRCIVHSIVLWDLFYAGLLLQRAPAFGGGFSLYLCLFLAIFGVQ